MKHSLVFECSLCHKTRVYKWRKEDVKFYLEDTHVLMSCNKCKHTGRYTHRNAGRRLTVLEDADKGE